MINFKFGNPFGDRWASYKYEFHKKKKYVFYVYFCLHRSIIGIVSHFGNHFGFGKSGVGGVEKCGGERIFTDKNRTLQKSAPAQPHNRSNYFLVQANFPEFYNFFKNFLNLIYIIL